jgi:hypothetical protein
MHNRRRGTSSSSSSSMQQRPSETQDFGGVAQSDYHMMPGGLQRRHAQQHGTSSAKYNSICNRTALEQCLVLLQVEVLQQHQVQQPAWHQQRHIQQHLQLNSI